MPLADGLKRREETMLVFAQYFTKKRNVALCDAYCIVASLASCAVIKPPEKQGCKYL